MQRTDHLPLNAAGINWLKYIYAWQSWRTVLTAIAEPYRVCHPLSTVNTISSQYFPLTLTVQINLLTIQIRGLRKAELARLIQRQIEHWPYSTFNVSRTWRDVMVNELLNCQNGFTHSSEESTAGESTPLYAIYKQQDKQWMQWNIQLHLPCYQHCLALLPNSAIQGPNYT